MSFKILTETPATFDLPYSIGRVTLLIA